MKQPSFKAILNSGTLAGAAALLFRPEVDRHQERVASKQASGFRRSDKRMTTIGDKGRRRIRLHPFMMSVYKANAAKLNAMRFEDVEDIRLFKVAEQVARNNLAREMARN